jgi:hypothetical protein
MTLLEIVDALELEILAGGDRLDRTVSGGYCGDLLSNVLATARPGDLWITIQHHVNVVGVAQVAGLTGVLLAANALPAESMVAKSDELGVVLLRSPHSAFDLAGRLHRALSGEPR